MGRFRGAFLTAVCLLLSPSALAGLNDDAFRDYIFSVVCVNPQGNLALTCEAAAPVVGGGGGLPLTANISSLGTEELSTRPTDKTRLNEEKETSRLQIQRWGVFGSVDYRNLRKDDSVIETGYDGRTVVLTAGTDFQVTNKVLVGAALSLMDTRMDFNNDSAKMDVAGYELVTFANYPITDWLYLDGYIGSIQQQNDGRRAVRFSSIQYDAKSSFDSENTQWGMGFGTQTAIENLALDASLRFDSSRVKIDAYEETGGDAIINLNQRFDPQVVDSNKIILAVNSSLNISIRNGVMVPYVRGELINELDNDARHITSHLVVAPDKAAFVALTDAPDECFGRIGAGVQLLMPAGLMLFADVETLVGNALLNTWRLSTGLRIEL